MWDPKKTEPSVDASAAQSSLRVYLTALISGGLSPGECSDSDPAAAQDPGSGLSEDVDQVLPCEEHSSLGSVQDRALVSALISAVRDSLKLDSAAEASAKSSSFLGHTNQTAL